MGIYSFCKKGWETLGNLARSNSRATFLASQFCQFIFLVVCCEPRVCYFIGFFSAVEEKRLVVELSLVLKFLFLSDGET